MNMSEMEEFSEEIKAAEAASISLPCFLVLASPPGLQAIALIAAGKASGAIKDLAHCKEVAGDAGKLAAVLGESAFVGIIAGTIGKCACKSVFDDNGGNEDKPPKEHPRPGI